MEEVINDSDKLEDLRIKLFKYSGTIEQFQENIQKAITKVGDKWKDIQFKDFNDTYAKYQNDIKGFEELLKVVAQNTLPPLVAKLKEIEGTNVKSS